MYCRKCGNKLEDDALFCPECGTKVDREGMNQDVNSNADAPHYQNAASGQNNMGLEMQLATTIMRRLTGENILQWRILRDLLQ